MDFFLTLLVDGVLSGAIYALVALAFVLVWRASRMMNFALGDWMMVAAVLAGGGATLPLGAIGGLALAALGMLALAWAFWRLVVRRIADGPALSSIMATLGLGMVLRGGAALSGASLAPLVLPIGKPEAAAVALLCTVAVAAWWRWSRSGVALRAIADDRQAAMAMGIDVDRHLLGVWLLTGLVSLVAGLLWTSVIGGGFGVVLVGLKIFPIVILGGVDSIAGTLVAAVLVGVLESLGAGYLDRPLGAGFGSLAPTLALLAMLVLRPHGLFGRPRVERV